MKRSINIKEQIHKGIFKFYIKILLMVLFATIPLIIFDLITYKSTILKLSTSNSFNIKLWKMHNINSSKINIISIGSSITLNNLNTESIIKKYDSSYYNTSSWGFRINNQYDFLKIITNIYKPSVVITVSQVVDYL